MKRFLSRLFGFWPSRFVIPRASAPAVPFRPFSAITLTPAQVRDALAGQADNLSIVAIVQILEGQLCIAVNEMAAGVDGARGTYRLLSEFYEGLTTMLKPSQPAEK